ncbi:MAG TPA: DeoR/GlpR family DNA-binding transcription regulator [Propionibacteriaceae bacterium]
MTMPRLPRDGSLPARRREDLLAIVHSSGQATVVELAERFEVSADTVRRDIDFLVEQGLLARTHGGAVPPSSRATANTPLDRRMQVAQEVKTAIGETAARLVADGETIIVNGGTTTLAFAAALTSRRDLTVVTNSLVLPASLPSEAIRDVYLIGGEIWLNSMTTVGPVRFPSSTGGGSHAISADVAVIGVGGISVKNGLSTSNLPEAQMMRDMIGGAGRLIVVVDSTKLGHNAFAQICTLDRIDQLVSDIALDHPVAQAVIESGGEVVQPGDPSTP